MPSAELGVCKENLVISLQHKVPDSLIYFMFQFLRNSTESLGVSLACCAPGLTSAESTVLPHCSAFLLHL